MSLQDKLNAIKAQIEAKAPAEAIQLMHRATEELRASGLAEKALGVGQKAPAFSLVSAAGETVNSQELLARGPLVVTFYRGAW